MLTQSPDKCSSSISAAREPVIGISVLTRESRYQILQAGKYYHPRKGGIEQVTRELAEGLTELGHLCDVLVAGSENSTCHEVIGGVDVCRAATYGTFMSTPMSFAYARELIEGARKYDIIEVHLPNPLASAALALSGRTKSAIVVMWHADATSYGAAYKLVAPVDQLLLRRARAIIVTSERYAATSKPLEGHGGKIHIVPLGIESKTLYDAHTVVPSVKKRFIGKKLVFSIGRLVPYKGFDILIRAARYLPDDVMLLIGGDGRQAPSLQKLIRAEGAHEKVVLLGRLSDLDAAAYMDACDLFCLPSITRAEAFGVALLEAMRAAKPIVATDIPGSGVPWVNDHGTTGFNVKPGRPAALAERISAVLDDPALCRQLGDAARARFLQRFTRERMVTDTLAVFQKVG